MTGNICREFNCAFCELDFFTNLNSAYIKFYGVLFWSSDSVRNCPLFPREQRTSRRNNSWDMTNNHILFHNCHSVRIGCISRLLDTLQHFSFDSDPNIFMMMVSMNTDIYFKTFHSTSVVWCGEKMPGCKACV